MLGETRLSCLSRTQFPHLKQPGSAGMIFNIFSVLIFWDLDLRQRLLCPIGFKIILWAGAGPLQLGGNTAIPRALAGLRYQFSDTAVNCYLEFDLIEQALLLVKHLERFLRGERILETTVYCINKSGPEHKGR